MRAQLVPACFLLSSSVLAADLPADVPPARLPHVVPLSWTGAHGGVSGTVGAGMTDWTLRPSGAATVTRETRTGGGAYGIEAGFDVEFDQLAVASPGIGDLDR